MNFTSEDFDRYEIPGVGTRVDFNLTPRDAIEGVFVEITAASTLAVTAPTLLGGVFQVDTLTFPDTGSATAGDFILITDTSGDEWAASLDLTGADPAPSGAIYTAVPAGQRVHVDLSSISASDTAVTGVAEVDTLTFPALAGASASDYVVITDVDGNTWAVALDTTGADAAPTGAAWVAVDVARKVQANISGDVSAADVAATCETALNGLTGFSSVITTDDSAADGTMTLTHAGRKNVTDPDPKNADDTGVGSITVAETTAGVQTTVDTSADTINFGAHGWYTGVKGQLTISGGTLPTGLALTTDYWLIREDADKVKFATSLADAVAGTAVSITDEGTAGETITFTVSDNASAVAALVEAGLNGLLGFSTVITTDDTASDGTMSLTHTVRGPVTNPVPYDSAETGVGSITTSATTAGVASAVDVSADSVTFGSAQAWFTGKPVVPTSTGALPTGLTSGTTYYLIRVSSTEFQFATSLANAVAGTEINLTDQGDAGATITITPSGPVVGYLFNSMTRLTDSELDTAITTEQVYDVNAVTAKKYMIAQIGCDFSTYTKNRIFIKTGETFDSFTLPDELLPLLTLRLDDTSLRVTDVKITRRGVV